MTLRWRLGRGTISRLLGLVLVVFGCVQPLMVPGAAADGLTAQVNASVSSADSHGIDQHVAVIDRNTGKLIVSTSNAHDTLASESIVKLFIAVWWLRQANGDASAVSCGDIGYMIRVSDNATATACWRSGIISDVSSWYGLTDSTADPTQPNYWGATRVSAADIATLLYRAGQDPLVSSWLINQMMQASDTFVDGSNQNYGFNTLAGAGSKQGWGSDAYWLTTTMMVHSAGYVNNVAAAVLQAGDSESDSDQMESSATATAQTIAAQTTGTGGAIGQEYGQLGGLGGALGFPVSAQQKTFGGHYQVFENGRIYSSSAGTCAVTGAALQRYGHSGSLGWPTANEQDVADGTQQIFRRGRIYQNSSAGVHIVKGEVLTSYLAKGGPAGSLGWPTAEQSQSASGIVQQFQHGTVQLNDIAVHPVLAWAVGALVALGLATVLLRLRARRRAEASAGSRARRGV